MESWGLDYVDPRTHHTTIRMESKSQGVKESKESWIESWGLDCVCLRNHHTTIRMESRNCHGWSRELTIVLVHTLITPPLGWSQKVDESMSHGWSHEFSIVWVVLTLITPPIKMELRSQGDQGVLDGVMNSVLCGSCTHSLHHLLASIMFHFVFSIMTSSVHSWVRGSERVMSHESWVLITCVVRSITLPYNSMTTPFLLNIPNREVRCILYILYVMIVHGFKLTGDDLRLVAHA